MKNIIDSLGDETKEEREFTLADLEAGMLVVISGENLLVLPNATAYPGKFVFAYDEGFDDMGGYEGFDYPEDSYFNIDKVYSNTDDYSHGLLSTKNRKLLWARHPRIRFTGDRM